VKLDDTPVKGMTLSDAVKVVGILEALPAESLELLRSVCYAGLYNLNIPDDELIARPAFRKLYDLGLLGVGKEYWGTVRIVVPEETSIILINFFRSRDRDRLSELENTPVDAVRSNADSLVRNITTLISISELHGIPLTAQGEISKPFLARKVLPFMETGAYGPTEDGRYPLDFLHAWRFCMRFDILKTQSGAIVSSSMADSFLEATDEVIGEALLTYVMESRDALPIGWFVETLRSLPQARWITVSRMLEVCSPDNLGKKEAAEYTRLWEDAILLLEMMGILDTGMAADRKVISLGRIWRHEPEQQLRTNELILTPDFKICAPRNLQPSIRRMISRFALFVKSDLMDQWEITQASVLRAIDEGLAAEKIITVLKDHSTFPLPKNVTDSLLIWQQNHQGVVYHHGPVLILDSPSDSKTVRDLLEKSGGVLANPAPNVFILHPHKADDILQKIRARRTVGRIAVPRIRKSSGDFSSALTARIVRSVSQSDSRTHINIISL
ncbi:MAG: helicase-associated domain-containing protein, partial [Candidatus Hydrogenedentota bacterium]